MTDVAPATQPVRRRRRGKKAPRHAFDRRTRLARRAIRLAAIFREHLGEDAADPAVEAAIQRCAETTALSEHLRAQMFAGKAVSAETVLRLTRTADLLARTLGLGLDRRRQAQRPVDVGPSLGDLFGGSP